jgi:ATP-dependent DNA ligase
MLPTLFVLKSGKRRRQWRVWVDGISVHKEWGTEGGKLVTGNEPIKTTVKNKGKRNEVSPEEQAILVAERLWIKKIEEGYYPDENNEYGNKLLSNLNQEMPTILPMLAETYKGNVNFPCIVQPKLDGIHCIARLWNNEVVLTSRNGKKFNDSILNHIKKDLHSVLKENKNLILAGELYTHLPDNLIEGQTHLQYVQSRCAIGRKTPHEDESHIQYWIYDIIPEDDTIPYKIRNEQLKEYERGNIIYTPTIEVNITDELTNFYEQCLENFYEGIMLKDIEGLYIRNKRVKHVLKMKPDMDREDIIVDIKEGQGNHAGCAVFLMRAEDGKEYWCTPKATLKQRQLWFEQREELIGKKATVKYLDLTDDGIPKFANVISIRDYE